MCFYVHQDHNEPKTAEEDIPCFKVLIKRQHTPIMSCFKVLIKRQHTPIMSPPDFVSPVRGTPYVLGKTQKSSIGKPFNGGSETSIIEEGLHSHSLRYMTVTELVFDAFIPKGSTYYYNPAWHEYVSDRLVVTKLSH